MREKSSHYGLDMLGYTRAAKLETKGHENVNFSKSLKTSSVRIGD
jgi:hypothetical protein